MKSLCEKADECATFIGEYCLRYGRVNVTQYKEKFETVRVYISPSCDVHSLLFPGYTYLRGPRWTYRFTMWELPRWVTRPLWAWQRFVYRRAYKLALKRWPELTYQMLAFADYPEFLKGLECTGC